MLVNDTHKRATKAALALLVAGRGCSPRLAAEAVQRAQEHYSLRSGNMATLAAKIRYAAGVAEKGEKSSNRRWGSYQEIGSLATKVANYWSPISDDGEWLAD